jgi:transcriptional regulator with XRE-family HTH domain
MGAITPVDISRLVRRLRDEAGLTQRELAERVGTTQSVISRLESDEYEGHSLSMLYRIGAALNRRIVVTAVEEGSSRLSVGEYPSGFPAEQPSPGSMGEDARWMSLRETAPSYGRADAAARELEEGLTSDQVDRFARRLARRFREQGVTEVDVREAIRWAKGGTGRRSLAELRGVIEVEPGDVVEDVRRARAQRGREASRTR